MHPSSFTKKKGINFIDKIRYWAFTIIRHLAKFMLSIIRAGIWLHIRNLIAWTEIVWTSHVSYMRLLDVWPVQSLSNYLVRVYYEVRSALTELSQKNPILIALSLSFIGRSWKASELRLKSWDDLHKLWYVLLKEKNMLMTQRQMLHAQNLRFPNPESVSKVCITFFSVNPLISFVGYFFPKMLDYLFMVLSS